MDILSSVLEQLRFKARLRFDGGLCGAWVLIDKPATPMTTLHVVTKGRAWLHVPPPAEPIALHTGDVVLIPRDTGFPISFSRTESAPTEAPQLTDWHQAEAALICGAVHFHHDAPQWLLSHFPVVVPVRGDQASSLTALIEILRRESASVEAGRDAVIERLTDTLFLLLLRHALVSDIVQIGLLAGLRDAAIQRALASFHRAPEKPWQLMSLANAAGLSRSAFVERFTRLVGSAPMEYVTRWRMQLACSLLARKQPLSHIAEQVGYTSEAAFSKAFKRVMGSSPRHYSSSIG